MSSLPTTLGQYQIIREIARSNDIVYEAYDPLMNRRVAIKELAAPNGLSPQQKEERVSRFKREAQAAGSLNHPNIMTVYSFAEDAGRHFMAMEYLDGHTLRNEIDTKGFLTIDRAVEIAVAVLQGLGHAHAKGVIHRDIKPDNIQILSDGEIKITDFGIARLTFQPNLTMDGQVFGTPSYMSPEQVVGKEIDQRSDLFSVGILLYEMLSGQKPFVGDNVVAISHAIMNKEPSQPPTITIELWRVISKAIQKTPMLRYQSSDEFIADLRSAINVRDAVDPGTYGSPYGGGAPVPHAAPAPAPGYAFNPYVSPQPAVVPPPVVQPQTSFPVPQSNPYYTQAPIYYPPPPRQPLLKPEQSLFVKRLLMTVMLVGTLFLVVVVGVSELSKAVQRWNAERTDAELVQKLRD
ncbi:MAG TPA: serine/threonine-protein kinase, partial [Fimbriimonas sp.]